MAHVKGSETTVSVFGQAKQIAGWKRDGVMVDCKTGADTFGAEPHNRHNDAEKREPSNFHYMLYVLTIGARGECGTPEDVYR